MAKELETGDIMQILSQIFNPKDWDHLANISEIQEKVLVGTALKQVADALLTDARQDALKMYRGLRGPETIGRVTLKYQPAYTQQVLDTKKVRKLMPPKDWEQLYKTRDAKETVAFTVEESPTHPMDTEVPF